MDDGIVVTDVVTLGGLVRLSGHSDDKYYEHLTTFPGAELDVLTIMSLLLEPGAAFVDVGANIGFETIIGAKIVGDDGRVFSFEPSAHNYDLLTQNIDLNGVGKTVTTFPFGLSDHAAEHILHFTSWNRGGAFISSMDKNEYYELEEPIHTKVLDEISTSTIDRCDVVKVDIEGHEPSFLRGAISFLSQHQPACILEANHWCLDALTNVTMPDYLEQLRSIFPYIYAFDNQEIADIREREIHFLVENIVRGRFQNLYCDFDSRRAQDVAARYTRFLQADSAYTRQLEQSNARLLGEANALRTELEGIKRSRSHRLAVEVNRILRR